VPPNEVVCFEIGMSSFLYLGSNIAKESADNRDKRAEKKII
jgi:hypothetical protein